MALNWSGGGTGALSGAGVGSAFGPWGSAVGGLIGGLSGLFSQGAENDSLQKYDQGTPQQRQLHNSILARAMGLQGNGGGLDRADQYYNNLLGGDQQQAFNQFSAPYLQQFQEQMLPQIAERFAGAGALSSSGFGQAIGGASAGLQAQLAQLFSQLQGNAAQQQYGQHNNLASMGLNYEPFGYQKNKGTTGYAGGYFSDPENLERSISGIMSLFKKQGASSAAPPANTGGIF